MSNEPTQFVTITQTAAHFGVSARSVNRLISEGSLRTRPAPDDDGHGAESVGNQPTGKISGMKLILTIEEAASALGVSTADVRRLVREGKLRRRRIQRANRFPS
jgi:excisionase family DNA binding protein